MELIFSLKGIAIGFIMAIPIGPISIMCIRKTLSEGRLSGLIIGLGAATADLFYASVAAFGLTFISDTLVGQRLWIRLVGGGVLLFIGIRIFRALPEDPKIRINKSGILRSYLTTFFLTLTNPLTIFVFLAVFAALGLGNGLGYFSHSILLTGVFIGYGLWFLILSSGTILFRKKLDLVGLRWVNKIAGILIIISGVIVFLTLL
jgi:threonine/homoserine/homoserine lactone efflux protein